MKCVTTEQEAETQASTAVGQLGSQAGDCQNRTPGRAASLPCRSVSVNRPPKLQPLSLHPIKPGLEASLPPGSRREQTGVMNSKLPHQISLEMRKITK